jgi:nucleoside-diphosphate-sugar epimerase
MDIDLVSVKEAVKAARETGVVHFIYMSVSMYPTSIMKSYREVRAAGEKLLSDSGIKASFIRPWYILGPGHWWPVLLKPFYMVAKMLPSTRAAAKELDTVTIKQMIGTLIYAVQHQPVENAVYNISQIKTFTIKN